MKEISGNALLELKPLAYKLGDEYWFMSLIIIIIASIAYLKTFQPKSVKFLFKSLADNRHIVKIVKDEININSASFFIFSINAILIFGLFVLFLISHFSKNLFSNSSNHLTLYLQICGFILVFFGLKYLLTLFIEFITHEKSGSTANRYNMLVSSQVLGFILLPIIILLAYFGNESFQLFTLKIGSTIIIIAFTYRLLIGIINSIKQKISKFYIFLYLCTLEILPLIVLIKALEDNIQ